MPSKLTAFDGYDKEKSSAAYRLQNWRFLRGKTGGANDAGLHGGLYQVNFADNQEPVLAYLKKTRRKIKISAKYSPVS